MTPNIQKKSKVLAASAASTSPGLIIDCMWLRSSKWKMAVFISIVSAYPGYKGLFYSYQGRVGGGGGASSPIGGNSWHFLELEVVPFFVFVFNVLVFLAGRYSRAWSASSTNSRVSHIRCNARTPLVCTATFASRLCWTIDFVGVDARRHAGDLAFELYGFRLGSLRRVMRRIITQLRLQ